MEIVEASERQCPDRQLPVVLRITNLGPASCRAVNRSVNPKNRNACEQENSRKGPWRFREIEVAQSGSLLLNLRVDHGARFLGRKLAREAPASARKANSTRSKTET